MLTETLWLTVVCVVAVVMSAQMEWQPQFDGGTLKLAAIALVIPAFGEELLFRVLALPTPEPDSSFPWVRAVLAIAAFVLWHPLQAWLFGGVRGEIFLDPWFLIAVAALGIACTRAWWRTGSIWPPVLLHWLVVVGWKALAGGPALV